jgi:hypothetical protein
MGLVPTVRAETLTIEQLMELAGRVACRNRS